MELPEMGHNGEIDLVFNKWMAGTCNKQEWERLLELAGQEKNEFEFQKVLKTRWQAVTQQETEKIANWEDKCRSITESDKAISETATDVLPHSQRRNWIRYVAAAIVVLAVGAYLWTTNQNEKPSASPAEAMAKAGTQNDVAPGGNRATLTLADGSKIILDSAGNGTIAKEGGSTITKKGDQVIYSLPSAVSRLPIPQYNTMTTPRGGQFQLTLPDGSQVWLNAESSITYPTAFTGNERKVSITGEAYFEVTRDKKKPFRVDIGNAEIEVLGTKFNINSYPEERTKNTTLIEGSVRITTSPVSRLPSPDNSVHTSLMLRPGQQGQLTDRGLFLATKLDVEQVMAWKNGLFNFNNVKLTEAMKQLARWYDVEVVYEKDPPDITFGGMMGRDLNLSQVLKVLKTAGVRYRIEGKKLIVTN